MPALIRKARMEDRPAIHEAHMRSIREVCVKDHGVEEIKGWGYRELGDRWIEGIEKGLVWVVVYDGAVKGVAAVAIRSDNNAAHVQAAYLTPEIIGQGLGRMLMTTLLEHVERLGIKTVSLDSTITAHGFYKKLGFCDSGPMEKTPIAGVPVTSFPMRRTF